MSIVLISVLIFVDLLLLAVIYQLSKKRPVDGLVLREVADERAMLDELRKSIEEELQSARRESQMRLEKVSKIAAEVEQDLKSSTQTIAGQVEEIANEITDKLNEPIKKLAKKQMSIESLLTKVELQKESLSKMLDRGEKLCKFFNNNISYEEILEEIEDKKYSDALQLMAKGMTPEKVAVEVGITQSEAKLLAGISHHQR